MPAVRTVARNQEGRPRSRMYEVVHRISDRFEPQVASAFVRALTRLDAGIDDADLRSAIAAGSNAQIVSAVRTDRLTALFAGGESVSEVLQRTGGTTGAASAEIIEEATGLTMQFNRVDPNVVMFARERAADLVVRVGEDVREAIRIVVATGSSEGLTTVQQARAIREVVGLPPNWANAPMNLRRDILDGLEAAATSRRLSATDKAEIRSRIARGTATEEFADEMSRRYAASLTNRRALNIARTETAFAANHGMRESWKQGIQQGVLPDTSRRMWIVTPDDRLRETHAAVPSMNPDGIPMDGVFETPLGPSPGPPLEPLCRCSEGLTFPGQSGVL